MSDEAHFSAEQSGSRAPARVSDTDVHSGRSRRDSQSPCPRPQKTVRLTPIRKRSDFLAANSARRFATPGFVLLVRDRGDLDATMRLGITVTKKIGNAVIRNRMKRRFRALANDVIAASGKSGADHILIGRLGGIERDYALIRSELDKAVKRAVQ